MARCNIPIVIWMLAMACTTETPSQRQSNSARGSLLAGAGEGILVDANSFENLFERYEDSYPVTTWTDGTGYTRTVTGDGYFQGCPSEPRGPRSGRTFCAEPYRERNGNGTFDGAFLAGFTHSRTSLEVHDPLKVVAWSIRVGDVIAGFATLDAVGYHYSEVEEIRRTLLHDGYRFDMLIISSTHNHEAPDLMGQWGPQPGKDLSDLPITTGVTEPYRTHVRSVTVQALKDAYADLAPRTICPAQASSSVNPLLTDWPTAYTDLAYQKSGADLRNAAAHGGRKYLIEGLENDHRDPVVFNPHLNTILIRNPDRSVRTTIVNTHSHPEVLWSENRLITADYPGYLRDRLAQLSPGSSGQVVIGSVGGIIGPHEVPIALRDDQGNVAITDLTDLEGTPILNPETGLPYRVPELAPDETFAKSRALGYTYAELAHAAAEKAPCFDRAELRVAESEFLMPIENPAFILAGFMQLFPRPVYNRNGEPIRGDLISALGYYPTEALAYAKTRISAARLLLGDTDALTVVSAPGEIFPETVIGYPEDINDPSREADYWPMGRALRARQCCTTQFTLEDLFWPEGSGRQEHYMLYGLGNDELGYFVNRSDFIKYHPILDDGPDDHYEESNSVGPSNETILKREYSRIADLLRR